ncbi:MAG: hypothetical protein QXR09_03870 [Candidatus Aenigmatarchaeota archaeon]
MKNKVLIVIASVAALALIALSSQYSGFISLSIGIPKSEVSKKLKSLYELANPGTTIEVIALNEQSGLYKALLKASGITGTNYLEVYVTKDGKLLTQSVIFVEQSIEQMKRLKNFVDCLESKNVKIFGLRNDTLTLLQLNILGAYSPKLFVPCDGEMVSNCISAKVERVPSVVFGGRVEPGVKSIEWFEAATGCKY